MLRGIFTFFGLTSLAYGIGMLAAPDQFSSMLPINILGKELLIRVLGTMYALSGIGLLWGMMNIDRAYTVLVSVASFYALILTLRLPILATGNLPTRYWRFEFVAVLFPAVVLCSIAWPRIWNKLIVDE